MRIGCVAGFPLSAFAAVLLSLSRASAPLQLSLGERQPKPTLLGELSELWEIRK